MDLARNLPCYENKPQITQITQIKKNRRNRRNLRFPLFSLSPGEANGLMTNCHENSHQESTGHWPVFSLCVLCALCGKISILSGRKRAFMSKWPFLFFRIDILKKQYILLGYINRIPGGNMSKVLSLKLKDDIFQEIEEIVKKLKMPRNTYINEALSYFNLQNRRKLLQKKLEIESRRVQKNSMAVLEEFEQLEDGSSG